MAFCVLPILAFVLSKDADAAQSIDYMFGKQYLQRTEYGVGHEDCDTVPVPLASA